MENLGKKVGFLKGLMEGASYDADSPKGKLLAGIVELLGDLSDRVEAMDELLDDLNDYVESIDEDLTELEGERDGEAEEAVRRQGEGMEGHGGSFRGGSAQKRLCKHAQKPGKKQTVGAFAKVWKICLDFAKHWQNPSRAPQLVLPRFGTPRRLKPPLVPCPACGARLEIRERHAPVGCTASAHFVAKTA